MKSNIEREINARICVCKDKDNVMREPTVMDFTAAHLLSLIQVLATAEGIVLGTVALVTGWRLFRDRPRVQFKRGTEVPSGDATGAALGSLR